MSWIPKHTRESTAPSLQLCRACKLLWICWLRPLSPLLLAPSNFKCLSHRALLRLAARLRTWTRQTSRCSNCSRYLICCNGHRLYRLGQPSTSSRSIAPSRERRLGDDARRYLSYLKSVRNDKLERIEYIALFRSLIDDSFVLLNL